MVLRQPGGNLLDRIDLRKGADGKFNLTLPPLPQLVAFLDDNGSYSFLCYQVTVRTIPPSSTAPTASVGSAMAAIGNKLYLFSGRGGVDMAPIEDEGGVWQYHTDDAGWSLLKPADPSAPFPSGRSYHAMASNSEDEIYVHAGCPEKGHLSDLWSSNVSTRTWTALPNAPEPARGGTSLTYGVGKLYRMSGFDRSKEQGGSIDVLDLESKIWITPSFPG